MGGRPCPPTTQKEYQRNNKENIMKIAVAKTLDTVEREREREREYTI